MDEYPPPPELCVGENTSLDATEGVVTAPVEEVSKSPAEYLEPEESATFRMIPSGVRSRSDLAVTWT